MLNVFTIYDSASKIYDHPFFSLTDESAVRMFDQIVNGGKGMIGQYPEHFSLFRLGTFDEREAKFEFEVAPCRLVTAQSLKKGTEVKHG